MNNRGRGTGFVIIIIIVIALLIAFLVMKQADSIGFGGRSNLITQQEDPLNQAQDAVDAINSRLQQQYDELTGD